MVNSLDSLPVVVAQLPNVQTLVAQGQTHPLVAQAAAQAAAKELLRQNREQVRPVETQVETEGAGGEDHSETGAARKAKSRGKPDEPGDDMGDTGLIVDLNI